MLDDSNLQTLQTSKMLQKFLKSACHAQHISSRCCKASTSTSSPSTRCNCLTARCFIKSQGIGLRLRWLIIKLAKLLHVDYKVNINAVRATSVDLKSQCQARRVVCKFQNAHIFEQVLRYVDSKHTIFDA